MWLALNRLLFSWWLKRYLKSKFLEFIGILLLMLAKCEKLYSKAKSALLKSFLVNEFGFTMTMKYFQF